MFNLCKKTKQDPRTCEHNYVIEDSLTMLEVCTKCGEYLFATHQREWIEQHEADYATNSASFIAIVLKSPSFDEAEKIIIEFKKEHGAQWLAGKEKDFIAEDIGKYVLSLKHNIFWGTQRVISQVWHKDNHYQLVDVVPLDYIWVNYRFKDVFAEYVSSMSEGNNKRNG